MYTSWQRTKSTITKLKLAVFTAAFATATLVPLLASPGIAHAIGGINHTRQDAWGTVEVAGSGWLNGSGVSIYSNGPLGPAGPSPDTLKYIDNVNGDSTQTGIEWQCVELINRLYLTYGWITDRWTGNGDQMYSNAPTGLTKQTNGAITNLAVGDVVAFSGGGVGHVAIVNSVSGSTVQIASQNTDAVYDGTFTISSGTLSTTGWATYTIQGVIHAPAPSSTWWARTSGINSSRTQVADVALSDGTENMFTVSSTGNLKLKWWAPSSGWSSWVDLGAPTSPLESISVVYTPDKHWDVYGLSDNGHLYQDEYVTGWSGWSDHGTPSSAINGITAKIYPTDKSQFIYATTADGHLWQINSSGGGALGSWIDRGVPSSNLIGTPSELITPDKHIYIFAVSANGHLWQKDWASGVWGNFVDRGVPTSSLTNAPSTALSGDGTIDIFSESSSDGHLWEKRWNGSWTGWIDHGTQGGGFIGSPTVVLSPDDHKDMYAVTANGHLWQRDWTASTDWTGWIDRGVPSGVTFSGSPNAILRPDNGSQDIYLIGSDGHMWQKNYDAPSHIWSWIDRGAF